jgi:ribonuclease HI
MRIFTDGACSKNGQKGAYAGFAVWFPEHPDWSHAQRLAPTESQTNQRAELSAIVHAIRILESKGCYDDDLVIYSDSDYSINCLTKWLPGWNARGWKTAQGKDVLHQDLIREVSGALAKFKSHRFHHVRAHTGAADDLSKNNDIVDRMARGSIDDTVKVEVPVATDELFPGCPLQLMGPPIAQETITQWVRDNLNTLDSDIVNKHLAKAFAEMCKARDVTLTKQVIQKRAMIRAEVGHLQISSDVVVE